MCLLVVGDLGDPPGVPLITREPGGQEGADDLGRLVQRVARYRALVRRGLARAFETVDAIAMPTVPTTAPPVERPRVQLPSGPASADASALHYAALANLTGVPAISVPCGRDAEGLPIGICFHARWGEEAALLALGERLERSTERSFTLSGPAAAPNHPEVSR